MQEFIRKPPTEVIFRDFDYHFLAHPITGNLMMVSNDEAVKQSVKLLVLTDMYESLMQPEISGGVRGSMFENIIGDDSALTILRMKIEEVIRNNEPRVEKVHSVAVDTEITDTNTVKITIIFSIVNRHDPLSVSFFLNRVR